MHQDKRAVQPIISNIFSNDAMGRMGGKEKG